MQQGGKLSHAERVRTKSDQGDREPEQSQALPEVVDVQAADVADDQLRVGGRGQHLR